jgi:hypothetical protein
METEPSRGLSEEQVDITLDFSPSDTTEKEKTEYEKFQHLVTDLIVVQNRRSIFVSTVELCGEGPEHTAIDESTLNVGKMMDKFNDELTVLVDERLYKGIVDENIFEIIKSWMGKRENEMNQFRLMGKNRKFMSNIMNFLDSYKSTDMKVTEADLSGSVKVNAKSRTI